MPKSYGGNKRRLYTLTELHKQYAEVLLAFFHPEPCVIDVCVPAGVSDEAEIVPVKWHNTMFRHTLEGPDDMTGHVKVRAEHMHVDI